MPSSRLGSVHDNDSRAARALPAGERWAKPERLPGSRRSIALRPPPGRCAAPAIILRRVNVGRPSDRVALIPDH